MVIILWFLYGGILMEIPSWFGVDEYYWMLRTIIFGLSIWMVGQMFRANIVKTSKEYVSKFKSWWKEHKEVKLYGKN